MGLSRVFSRNAANIMLPPSYEGSDPETGSGPRRSTMPRPTMPRTTMLRFGGRFSPGSEPTPGPPDGPPPIRRDCLTLSGRRDRPEGIPKPLAWKGRRSTIRTPVDDPDPETGRPPDGPRPAVDERETETGPRDRTPDRERTARPDGPPRSTPRPPRPVDERTPGETPDPSSVPGSSTRW